MSSKLPVSPFALRDFLLNDARIEDGRGSAAALSLFSSQTLGNASSRITLAISLGYNPMIPGLGQYTVGDYFRAEAFLGTTVRGWSPGNLNYGGGYGVIFLDPTETGGWKLRLARLLHEAVHALYGLTNSDFWRAGIGSEGDDESITKWFKKHCIPKK